MSAKRMVAQSRDNIDVSVPKETVRRLVRRGIEHLVEEAIEQASLAGRPEKVTVDLGLEVGRMNLCEIPPVGRDEETQFARPKPGFATAFYPVTDTKCPANSSQVTMTFRHEGGRPLMVDLHVGPQTPRMPWDLVRNRARSDILERSLSFWTRHALVHDVQSMTAPFQSTWSKQLRRVRPKGSTPKDPFSAFVRKQGDEYLR